MVLDRTVNLDNLVDTSHLRNLFGDVIQEMGLKIGGEEDWFDNDYFQSKGVENKSYLVTKMTIMKKRLFFWTDCLYLKYCKNRKDTERFCIVENYQGLIPFDNTPYVKMFVGLIFDRLNKEKGDKNGT